MFGIKRGNRVDWDAVRACMSTEITSPKQLADLVSEPGKTVLVDFWAGWCGPCRALAKELPAVQEEFGENFTIAKVNVDEQQELAAHFKVTSIPMMLAFKDGEAVKMLVGAQPARSIIEQLKPVLS